MLRRPHLLPRPLPGPPALLERRPSWSPASISPSPQPQPTACHKPPSRRPTGSRSEMAKKVAFCVFGGQKIVKVAKKIKLVGSDITKTLTLWRVGPSYPPPSLQIFWEPLSNGWPRGRNKNFLTSARCPTLLPQDRDTGRWTRRESPTGVAERGGGRVVLFWGGGKAPPRLTTHFSHQHTHT